MINQLPDGDYPFASSRLPLSQMAMMEAPEELADLLRQAAAAQGEDIIRDRVVEISCTSEAWPDATFVVFWPSGEQKLHILAPRASVIGQA